MSNLDAFYQAMSKYSEDPATRKKLDDAIQNASNTIKAMDGAAANNKHIQKIGSVFQDGAFSASKFGKSLQEFGTYVSENKDDIISQNLQGQIINLGIAAIKVAKTQKLKSVQKDASILASKLKEL